MYVLLLLLLLDRLRAASPKQWGRYAKILHTREHCFFDGCFECRPRLTGQNKFGRPIPPPKKNCQVETPVFRACVCVRIVIISFPPPLSPRASTFSCCPSACFCRFSPLDLLCLGGVPEISSSSTWCFCIWWCSARCTTGRYR